MFPKGVSSEYLFAQESKFKAKIGFLYLTFQKDFTEVVVTL